MTNRSRYCVALTGRIASGKTVVSDFLSRYGAAVIDCDVISRRLTGPGGEAIPFISSLFGAELIDAHGALKRSEMALLVFSDQRLRKNLEGLLHPMIEREALKEMVSLPDCPYVVFVIPLLLAGSSWLSHVQRILLIRSSPWLQRARLRQRGMTSDMIERVLMTQETLDYYPNHDDLVENNGDFQMLAVLIRALHEKYCRLARTFLDIQNGFD